MEWKRLVKTSINPIKILENIMGDAFSKSDVYIDCNHEFTHKDKYGNTVCDNCSKIINLVKKPETTHRKKQEKVWKYNY